MERRVWLVDQRINDRGMKVDLQMCAAASKAVAANKEWQRAEMEMLTGVLNPGSPVQMKRWAEEENLGMYDFKAETIEAVLRDQQLTPVQRRALEIRQEYALTSYGKFDTALMTATADSRVRGAFNFFGAHTGRWSGRGVQLQNLPRQSFDNDADAALAVAELLAEGSADPQDLKRLVRAMFTGPLTVFDYASIEARVIAWLAGERWALDAFEAGRDIYVETQKRMGLRSRFEGKVAVLALGYQGSVGSLRALMGTAHLAADGTIAQGPGPEIPDEVLLKLVRQWRKGNTRIVNFWYDLQDALPSGGKVGQHINIRRRGNSMAIDLPSGRSIHYHGLRYDKANESWSYSNSRYGRTGTYGGRLAENVTQAVARDVLAEALVRLDEAGYPIVAHIHDEVVLDGEFDLESVRAVMNHPPRWARGLPIDSEGFHCLRYRKG
jgi:DNA polymerase